MIIDVGPDRYPECLHVVRTGFATVAADFGLTPHNSPTHPAFWHVEDLLGAVARPAELIGFEVAGAIVGCAFVGPCRGRPVSWTLSQLAVVPAARHRGRGEALVTEAARRARDGGASALRLGLIGENQRLREWYQRLGFATVSSGQQFPGLVFTVDHLELRL